MFNLALGNRNRKLKRGMWVFFFSQNFKQVSSLREMHFKYFKCIGLFFEYSIFRYTNFLYCCWAGLSVWELIFLIKTNCWINANTWGLGLLAQLLPIQEKGGLLYCEVVLAVSEQHVALEVWEKQHLLEWWAWAVVSWRRLGGHRSHCQRALATFSLALHSLPRLMTRHKEKYSRRWVKVEKEETVYQTICQSVSLPYGTWTLKMTKAKTGKLWPTSSFWLHAFFY